jgi:uncharacterized membrane protein YdbT with pleckstrin-like domain
LTREILDYIANPYSIAKMIFVNIFSTFIIIIWAYFECISKKYLINNDRLLFEEGFLLKHKFFINLKDISSLTLKRTILNSIFSVSKLSISTQTYKKKDCDISLTLKSKNAKKLFSIIATQKEKRKIYSSKTLQVMIMSFSWSNPISGFLILLPILNKIEKIWGNDKLRNDVYSKMDLGLKSALVNIPPVATNLIRITLVSWTLAFAFYIFQFLNFKSYLSEDNLFINRGFLSKIFKSIKLKNINAILIKQTVFMAILKIYNVYVDTDGKKNNRKNLNLLKIGCKKHELKEILNDFFAFSKHDCLEIKSPNNNIISFLLPNILFFLLSVTTFIWVILNEYQYFFILLATFLLVLSLWLLILSNLAFKTSGFCISKEKNIVIINTNDLFSIFSVVVPSNKINLIEIHQNLFQKKNNFCDIVISIFSKKEKLFRVKNLNITDVEEGLKKFIN